jgi:glutathione S-transferase
VTVTVSFPIPSAIAGRSAARKKAENEELPIIKLYHCAGSRSFRALWALEEMGLAYDLEMMPFPPRSRFENYHAINPLGTVPVMFDNGARMTESSAILHYLGTKFGPTEMVVQPDELGYADYLNFLLMGETTLTFPQTIVLRYTRLEPPERRTTQVAEDYRKWFGSRLRAAATMMGDRFACSNRFTMADISIGYALQLAASLELTELFPATLVPYFGALQSRDGYQRALAAERKAQN